MDFLSGGGDEKSGRCREVVLSGGSTVIHDSVGFWTSRCGFRI